MNDETIIQFRAREEVRRRSEVQAAPLRPIPATVPLLIHGDVRVEHFMRAAQTLGCEFEYDERLCAIVMYPSRVPV